MKKTKAKFIAKWIVAAILFILLFGLMTMFLWNWLIPSIFNGPKVNFIQALGLLLLAKMLFSSWGPRRRFGDGGGGPSWKHRYFDKLSSMSAEERERFKSRMKDKWCSGGKESSVEEPDNSNV
jgi:hypothetical protein